MFRLPNDTEMTLELLREFLAEHKKEVDRRYKKLRAAYESDHDILHQPAKPAYKPDNRIVVNFPKYIVDTMNGFFLGNPIKVVAEEKSVSAYVDYLDQYNDQDDNNAELAKICAVARLFIKPCRAMGVHEPDLLSLMSGANQIYAEVSVNPRDLSLSTETSRGASMDKARALLAAANWKY